MNPKILGDKRKSSFDDDLADYVNKIYDKIPEVPEKPVVENTNSTEPVYDLDYFLKLEIESVPCTSFDDQDGPDRFSFNESHKRIVRDGYERHLSFQEQVALAILLEEGKLTSNLAAIAHSILSDDLAWTNQAYELINAEGKGKLLRIYTGVTNLDYNGTNYDFSSLKFSGKIHTFSVKKLYFGSNGLKLVQKYYPDLIKFFYTRKFESLPEFIQESDEIVIPKKSGEIFPLARGVSNSTGVFDVTSIHETCEEEASSRGVRSQ